MKKYFIALSFLFYHAANLRSDDRIIGAALFGTSAIAFGALHHHNKKVDDAAVIIQNINNKEAAKARAHHISAINQELKEADKSLLHKFAKTIAVIPGPPAYLPFEQMENLSLEILVAMHNAPDFSNKPREEQEFIKKALNKQLNKRVDEKKAKLQNFSSKVSSSSPTTVATQVIPTADTANSTPLLITYTEEWHKQLPPKEPESFLLPTNQNPFDVAASAGAGTGSSLLAKAPATSRRHAQEKIVISASLENKLSEHLKFRNPGARIAEIEKLDQFNDQTKLESFVKKMGAAFPTNYPASYKFTTETANNQVFIAHKHTFIPHGPASGKPKIIITIHGTGAKTTTSFGGDLNNPSSRSLAIKTAQDALQNNALTQLLTIKWNGKYDQTARKASGENLATMLTNLGISAENYDIEMIAHSYGCDVGRHAINNLPAGTVQTLFTLASPNTDFDVSDKTQEIHVYGDLDAIATAETLKLSQKAGKQASTNLFNPHAHTNIRIPTNDHKKIKAAVRYLSKLKKIADEKDAAHQCLYARVTTQELEENPEDDIISADTSTYTIETQHDPSCGEANRPTFAQAAASEAASNGIANHITTRAALAGIGFLETVFGRPQSSSSDSSPSPTGSPK